MDEQADTVVEQVGAVPKPSAVGKQGFKQAKPDLAAVAPGAAAASEGVEEQKGGKKRKSSAAKAGHAAHDSAVEPSQPEAGTGEAMLMRFTPLTTATLGAAKGLMYTMPSKCCFLQVLLQSWRHCKR